jgi:hypothetical protein
MTRLSQEEGVISPNDWKLNAEGYPSSIVRRERARRFTDPRLDLMLRA